jgi:CspA family cold shock protein
MKGTVKNFNAEKGYGFILTAEGKDVFFHFSVIQCEGFKTLNAGDEVEFEFLETEKGLRATKVTKL